MHFTVHEPELRTVFRPRVAAIRVYVSRAIFLVRISSGNWVSVPLLPASQGLRQRHRGHTLAVTGPDWKGFPAARGASM
jgi:hypothetical protein